MAITPNEQPNQFMFTALPFEGMINYEMQQKRQRDAMNMQMNAQLGKFEGEMNAKKHWKNDNDAFDNVIAEVRAKTDEFLAQHPDGLSGNDAQRGFHRLIAESSNDPRLKAMAYNYQSILQAKKDIKKDTDMDDMAKVHEISKLEKFETMGKDGEINYYTQGGVKGYDRNKSILGIAEKVPAIKSFREMPVEDKVKFIKEEKLAFKEIIRKAKPYIDADPDIMRVKKYRVENGLQTAEDFDKEIAYHLAGAANLLEHSDEFNPSGGVKAAKDTTPKTNLGVGTITMNIDRDVAAEEFGVPQDVFEESGYNYGKYINSYEQQIEAIEGKGAQIEQAKLRKGELQLEVKETREKIKELESSPDASVRLQGASMRASVDYINKIQQVKQLENDIKILETPLTAIEQGEEQVRLNTLKAQRQSLKAMKELTSDAVLKAIGNNASISNAIASVKSIGGLSDSEALQAIATAAREVTDPETGVQYRKGEKGADRYGYTYYDREAMAFANGIADALGLGNTEQEVNTRRRLVNTLGTLGNKKRGEFVNALEKSEEIRKSESQRLLDERSKFSEGEQYSIGATDKDKRLAFGSHVIENSIKNADYADELNVTNVDPNSQNVTIQSILAVDPNAKIVHRAQMNGNVAGGTRKNVIDVTYKNSSNKSLVQTFFADIPKEFQEMSNKIYDRHIRKELTARGALKGEDESVDNAIVSAFHQMELQAIPKTDNLLIVDNGEGTEETKFKIRYKKLQDGTESYTPFIYDKATGKYTTISARGTQLNSRSLKDLTYQLARTAGVKAGQSTVIKDYDQTQNNVLGLVRKHESAKGKKNSGYNSIVNQNYNVINKRLGKPVTQATVNEIDKAAELEGKRESAMGAFQITRKTRDAFFDNTQYSKGFTKDSKFNKKLQDAMMTWLINSPEKGNYQKYEKSKKTAKDKKELALRLARVWASFPIETGKSYYSGDKYGNEAKFGYEELLKAIV